MCVSPLEVCITNNLLLHSTKCITDSISVADLVPCRSGQDGKAGSVVGGEGSQVLSPPDVAQHHILLCPGLIGGVGEQTVAGREDPTS